MNQNLATWDRAGRAVAAVGMLACSFLAPLPVVVRVLALGVSGAYMLATALFGACLGYKLLGVSTCPVVRKRNMS